MHWVERPFIEPHQCAVTLRGASQSERFIDTGQNVICRDPHIYVSQEGAESIARFLGWTSPDERAELEEHIETLEHANTDLNLQLAESDKFINAIDVLESAQFRARKKPGRPAATKA